MERRRTRMPARMHSEYLHKLFYRNQLAEGRFVAGGRRSRSAISARRYSHSQPRLDHVAPWRSVYQGQRAGRHRRDLPAHERRPQCRHRLRARPQASPLSASRPSGHLTTISTPISGSKRMKPTSQAPGGPNGCAGCEAGRTNKTAPPPMGAPQAGYQPLCDAPGAYVFESGHRLPDCCPPASPRRLIDSEH